jgi:SAM-dependent MidA family methyltransferase
MQQGEFLTMMGLQARIAALRAKAPPERQKVIEGAALRLVDMNSQIGMGTLFKVMALSSETKDMYPWTHANISL